VNDLSFTQGLDDSEFRYEQFALQVSQTFKPVENHTLTWGVDTRAEYLSAAASDPYMMTEGYVGTGLIGLYAQDEWRFAPKWALNVGARMDHEFYNGFQPSGRVALSYEPAKDSLIYAAVSDAFVLPTVGDRFQNEPILRNLGRLTSHVDMTPTTALTYELGYRGKFFDRLEMTAALFWNEYNDWPTAHIAPGPPSLFRLDYDTRASASMYGFELGTKYHLSRNLTLLGNYTFEQMNWRGSMDPTMEADINTPPKHKFMIGTQYSPVSDLHLSSYLYYTDTIHAPNSSMPFIPRHIPTYFRLDLRAEYEFWKKQASVAVGVKNLLEPNHREGGTLFLNDEEVPRMIYAEYRMTIR
jgi:outer membrane receptor protein involved in Fe transport